MTPLTYQVGALRVHLLSDGVFWSDGGAAFGVVPRVFWEKIIRPDALGRIAMELRSLLIESDDGLILVDTGHGHKLSAKRREQLGLTGQRRLLDELADPDPQVRGYAARALGHIGNEVAYERLAELLPDRSPLLKGTVGDEARAAREMMERRGRRSAPIAAAPEEAKP